jgi:hypothetical protein
MAKKRKFLLVIGQSNATAVADAPTWEDEHKTLRIRSPLAPRNVISGADSYQELFTMPGTFAGGPRLGRFSDGGEVGKWQQFDTRGLCINAIRFLTFYNPTCNYMNLGIGETYTFPGDGTIMPGSTPSVLQTSVRWQYDPVGLVITRKRTGSKHTVQAGWAAATNQITVSPTLYPPPEFGEVFSFPITGGAASSASELKLLNMCGGLCDVGSLLDTIAHSASIRTVLDAAGAPTFSRFTIKTRPVYVGEPVAFTKSAGIALVTSTTPATEIVTLLGANPFVVNDTVVFTDGGGGAIPGITLNIGYFVVYSVGLDIKVSTTRGGTPVNITGALAGIVAVQFHLPLAITPSATYYVTRLATELEEIAVQGWDDVNDKILAALPGVTSHTLTNNEKVRLTGTLPAELNTTTDYYVTVLDQQYVQLSLAPDGAAVAFSAQATISAKIVRQDAYFAFYVSATPGGTEVIITDAEAKSSIVTLQEVFVGSHTGCYITALTGANAGQTVPLADSYYSGGKGFLRLGTAFTNAPGAGDTYEITPPTDANGNAIPWKKWALFLPWCPFEGKATWSGPFQMAAGSLSESIGLPILATVPTIWPNEVLRFYGDGAVTPKVRLGQRYYSVEANTAAAYIASTYQGVRIDGTSVFASSGNVLATILRQEAKVNPFPPGFNHPNHYCITGGIYQPFTGPSRLGDPKMTFSTGLGVALAEALGEQVDIVQLAIGGTNLGHSEAPIVAPTLGIENFDGAAMMSWSPTGDPNNIFQRLLDTMDAAVLAWSAEGSVGAECVGIVWLQGEGDSSFEDLANRYYENGTRFKRAVREALFDRGLTAGPAEEVKWIDPHCENPPWQYSDVVNAAKDLMAAEDVFMRTGISQDDLPRIASLPGMAGVDVLHHTGKGMTILERRIYAQWVEMTKDERDLEAELAICNSALKHIGVTNTLTSFDDGSIEAEVCQSLFGEARDALLSLRQWDFALTRRVLTATTPPASPLYDHYKFCYLIPPDALCSFAVLPPNPNNDYQQAQSVSPSAFDERPVVEAMGRADAPFQIEQTDSGRRLLFTNQEDATLRYVTRIRDAGKFPSVFRSALSLQLGSLIAAPIIRGDAGEQVSQRLLRHMAAYLGAASSLAANQRSPQIQHVPNHISNR